MKKTLILLCTFIVAGELEVDGNLKVKGNIDAQNNPVTNVGAPQTMSDAVNAGILQSALSDDGVYEYKYFSSEFRFFSGNQGGGYSTEIKWKESGMEAANWNADWESKINQLSADGWTGKVISEFNGGSHHFTILYEFKRKVQE